MSGPGWMAISTGALLDGGVKATLVLTAGLGLAYMLRHQSASTRHGVYTATPAGQRGLDMGLRSAAPSSWPSSSVGTDTGA